MKHPQSAVTVLTLANAAELVACITKEIAGSEVAEQIDGSSLTKTVIVQLAMTSFQRHLSPLLENHNAQ